MSLPISVCILTLNEEEHIRDSINSISNFVDEVVVLDSGSVDRTIEEAKLTGAKIHTIKWKDDFSYARNKLIDLASSPFILMMDADERYIGDGSDLQTYIENSVSAGRVKIINLLDEEEQTETAIIRIFRKNPSLRYKGIIHEQLTDRGNAITGVNSEISLLHFGYKRESMEKKNKTKRNMNLLFKDYQSNPYDPYLLYQMGKTLYVSREYSEATRYFKKALVLLEERDLAYKFIPNLLLQYSYNLLKEKNWTELEIILNKSIEKYPDFTDLYYIYASWIIEEKKIEQFNLLPSLYTKCLEIGEADSTKYETTKGVGSFKALYNLGLYYEITGNLEKAMECYNLSSEMNYVIAKNRLDILSKKFV